MYNKNNFIIHLMSLTLDSSQTLKEAYDLWSTKYDILMEQTSYTGPNWIKEHLMYFKPDHQKVLDLLIY